MKNRYLVLGLAAVVALALSVPAVGEVSSSSDPTATTSNVPKKWKKRIKKALKRSKQARNLAQQALDAANSAQTDIDALIVRVTQLEQQGGAQGPRGPQGPQGEAGPQGPPGPTSAVALDGLAFDSINYVRTNNDANVVTVMNIGGLSILASCDGGDLEVDASTSIDNSFIKSASLDPNDNDVDNGTVDDDYDTGDLQNLLNQDEDQQNGHTSWFAPNGSHVTVHWDAVDGDEGFPDPDCAFTGYAVQGG